MDKKTFMAKFATVFENSDWVAEAVFDSGTGPVLDDAEALCNQFESAFINSDRGLQMATLRAHPPLACGLAEPGQLTSDSRTEQIGAGLDQCTEVEFREFQRLNAAYSEKFTYPFIIAVRGRNCEEILGIFRARLANDSVGEYQIALRQVCQIARFRIGDILNA